MKDYQNYFTCSCKSKKQLEEAFILDLYYDFYHETYFIGKEIFIEWLCKENLIGNDITPEVLLLYELSRE